MLSEEETRRRASEARKRFYGRDRGGPVLPPAEVADHHRPRAEKEGKPCPQTNATWLASLASRAMTLASVLASGEVAADVRAARDRKCEACPYSSKVDGLLYCGCCRCPHWRIGSVGSSVHYKNRKAAWFCPGPHEAFGRGDPVID